MIPCQFLLENLFKFSIVFSGFPSQQKPSKFIQIVNETTHSLGTRGLLFDHDLLDAGLE